MARISKEEMFLQMAEAAAGRSCCSRLHVGCVLTDDHFFSVLGIGYNGPEAGGPNDCSGEPGICGCVHAETNAAIKAPGDVPKLAFVTCWPCLRCAKMLINANVVQVFHRDTYRLTEGRDLLQSRHIPVTMVT